MSLITGCHATEALTKAEAKKLAELPDAEHAVDSEPGVCEFEKHDSDVMHARLAQNQFDGGAGISWWLRWNDTGYREIKVEPHCDLLDDADVEMVCLLVEKHPGKCEDGLSAEPGDTCSEFVLADEEDDGPFCVTCGHDACSRCREKHAASASAWCMPCLEAHEVPEEVREVELAQEKS